MVRDPRPEIRYVPGRGLPILGQGVPAQPVAPGPNEAVWLVDTALVPETGSGDEVFERGILPLERLAKVHRERFRADPGDTERMARIAVGDAVFLFVEGVAVVGSGKVREPYEGGDLSVEWRLEFHRRLPEEVEWDEEDFPYVEGLVLFDRDGGRSPFAVSPRPLLVSITSRDVMVLIRFGAVY